MDRLLYLLRSLQLVGDVPALTAREARVMSLGELAAAVEELRAQASALGA